MFQIRSIQTAEILSYIKLKFLSILGPFNFGDEEIKSVEGTTQDDDSMVKEICAIAIITLILVLVARVKSVQIRSIFWSVFSNIRTEYSPNTGKYGPENTPYLDTFHAVK